jgi:hypothetical protein
MMLTRLSTSVRRWLAERRSPWRSRDGTLVGAALPRGSGLPLRLALWVLLGVAVFFGLRYAIHAIAPTASNDKVEAATPWATLYVACSDPACHAARAVQKPMDFSAWPLVCEQCQKPTVYRATLCSRCGAWFARGASGAGDCWRCAERRAASQPRKPPRKPAASRAQTRMTTKTAGNPVNAAPSAGCESRVVTPARLWLNADG